MQINLMLNADHEIEDTVSVTSAVKIICYCIYGRQSKSVLLA